MERPSAADSTNGGVVPFDVDLFNGDVEGHPLVSNWIRFAHCLISVGCARDWNSRKVLMRLLVTVAFVAVLAWPSNAWAYIDPGAGSAAYQLLLPMVVGAGMLLRRAWQRISGPHKHK
jgi:hypothetical protein